MRAIPLPLVRGMQPRQTCRATAPARREEAGKLPVEQRLDLQRVPVHHDVECAQVAVLEVVAPSRQRQRLERRLVALHGGCVSGTSHDGGITKPSMPRSWDHMP